jgi:ParB-like chromosome segregation protein Spo0J
MKVPLDKIITDDYYDNLVLYGNDPLIEDMRQHNLLNPVTLTTIFNSDNYILVVGRRRVFAARALGWTDIEAIVVEEMGTHRIVALRLMEEAKKIPVKLTNIRKGVAGSMQRTGRALEDEAKQLNVTVEYLKAILFRNEGGNK